MEKETFNQEVLTINILIKVPISKINVPTISMKGNGFFLSEILLKNIVAMSISIKNTTVKAILINKLISSLNRKTKTYENPLACEMQLEF